MVFTKSDTIPYFSEYFSRLVENEDQQVLGCSLPAVAPGARPAGEVFAEAETARLAETFNGLYYSLADKRLDMLPREVNLSLKPAIYEFPRELKRIRDTLVQFLVDVFRPNPLQPGPILRGFYFSGTRQRDRFHPGPGFERTHGARGRFRRSHLALQPRRLSEEDGAGGRVRQLPTKPPSNAGALSRNCFIASSCPIPWARPWPLPAVATTCTSASPSAAPAPWHSSSACYGSAPGGTTPACWIMRKRLRRPAIRSSRIRARCPRSIR